MFALEHLEVLLLLLRKGSAFYLFLITFFSGVVLMPVVFVSATKTFTPLSSFQTFIMKITQKTKEV